MQGLPRFMPSHISARAVRRLFFNQHPGNQSAAYEMDFNARALKTTTPRSASPGQVPNVAPVPIAHRPSQ